VDCRHFNSGGSIPDPELYGAVPFVLAGFRDTVGTQSSDPEALAFESGIVFTQEFGKIMKKAVYCI
jgi:hypothetical protein